MHHDEVPGAVHTESESSVGEGAAAVGPEGRATGIDLSAEMVARTAADVRARGLTTVDLHVQDASAPDLPAGSYELAELLAGAGFGSVRTVGVDLAVTFAGAAQWRAWSLSHGQRAMRDAVPGPEREQVMAAAAGRLDAARGPDGRITLSQRVRLTMGVT